MVELRGVAITPLCPPEQALQQWVRKKGGGASGDFRIEPLEIGRRDSNGGVTERGRGGGGR